MTLQELKKMARRGLGKWCDDLPHDGDFNPPEIITDRVSGEGAAPRDGDYAVIMIFHNNKEGSEAAE